MTVATFYSPAPLETELRGAAVPLVDLRKTGRWDTLGFVKHLRQAICDAGPDVIYSFVGGANIFAAAVRPFAPPVALVWSIRSSDMDLTKYDWVHRFAYAIERRLSGVADLIISNSRAGLEFAAQHGFPRKRIAVVPNGIDVWRFRPDALLRQSQRAEWSLAEGDIAAGMLGRLDPMKGYPDFLHAAARVARERDDVKFICIGGGPEERELRALAEELGIADCVLFPGPTADPAAALNGLDLFCSASLTEGFSNAIAEAMACGLPCVVTDVGDSAMIVDGHGVVVPRSDAGALADAILHQLLALPAGSAVQGRAHVIREYSVDAMVDRTLSLLSDVLERSAQRRRRN